MPWYLNLAVIAPIILIVCGVSLLLLVIVLLSGNIYSGKYPVALIASTTISVITSVLLISLNALYIDARDHGAYTANLNILDTQSMIDNSPKDQSVQAEKHLSEHPVILLYRFGCSDCEKLKDSLGTWALMTADKYYWVSSRSEFGERLVDWYGITDVPAVLTWDKDSYHVTYPMDYYKDGELNMPTAKEL